ncbi:LmeA family phospholipid-binding protein [Streptacidiphilus rugosus]|uniref:LmeA family phospholipid-binding protein n=1 Tax=Streptacidiphilus rugosus TaxID=405783 RepID=UPI000569F7FA|nr:LmeA family phospholipid-binding protein [Streptacidiphilus rugosus]
MSGRFARTRASLRRRRAIVVTVCAVFVITAVSGELAARQLIRDRIAGSAHALGGDLTVGEGGDLALWDLVSQNIARLDLSSDDATLGPLSHVAVRASLDDIRLGGARPTVGSTHARVTVSTDSITEAIRSAAPTVSVSSVTGEPSNGTILVAVGPGGIGQLTLHPQVKDGRFTLAVAGLTVFGRPVRTTGLGGAALGSGPQPAYPLGLHATAVTVRPDALLIDLTGGAATLSAA